MHTNKSNHRRDFIDGAMAESFKNTSYSTARKKEGTITFVVDKARKKLKNVGSSACSDIEIINNIPWKLCIQHSPEGSIRVYPCVATGETLQKVYAECTIELISKSSTPKIVKLVQMFKPRKISDFNQLISWTELFSRDGRFVENGKVSVKVHIACGIMKKISSLDSSIKSMIENDIKVNNKGRGFSSERSRHILENCIGADCEFIVGSKGVIKTASKSTLVMASEVFEAMFCGSFPLCDPVPIPDIEDDIFEIMLKYINREEWQFESKLQAFEVYYAADKYMLQELLISCVEYIWPRDLKEVFVALEFAVRREMEVLKSRSLAIIRDNASEALLQEQFLDISHDSLMAVLQEDFLKVLSELEIFAAVLRWGKATCRKECLEINGTNLRSVIGECICHVRFLSMTCEEFSGIPRGSGLLTEAESAGILARIKTGCNQPNIGSLCCLKGKRCTRF